MAFTDEQVEGYSIQANAQERVDVVQRELHLLQRRLEIPGITKPEWTGNAVRLVLPSLTWIVQVVGLEGRSKEEWLALPSPGSAAGKALTKEAQQLDPEEWSAAGVSDAHNAIVFHVTLARRSSAIRKSKALKSMSNKYANALVAQHRQLVKVQAACSATVKAEVAEGE